MLTTFLRYFLIVGVTTTMVLIFCDTQEGQRLLVRAGLFLDEHGIPNHVAEAEKQSGNAPAAPGRLQLVKLPDTLNVPRYQSQIQYPSLHHVTNTVTCVGRA